MRHFTQKLYLPLVLAFAIGATPVTCIANPGGSLTDALTRLQDLKKQLDDTDFKAKPLADKKRNLDDTTDLLKGAFDNLQKKYDDLNMRIDGHTAKAGPLRDEKQALDASIDSHNGRCGGTYEDQGYVDACNSEAAQLNQQMADFNQRADAYDAEGADLKKEGDDLDDYQNGLKQRRDQLSQDTLDWAAAVKQYVADHNDLVARYNQVVAELQAYENDYSRCMSALHDPNTPADTVKYQCGDIDFDGKSVTLQALKASDIRPELVITPNGN